MAETRGLGEVVSAAERMCDGFTDIQGRRVTVDPRFARTWSALALIYGWTQQAFMYGRAAIPLLRAGDRAAIPLVREAYECGIRVQWIRWIPGAEIATVRKDSRSRRVLAADVSKFPDNADLQEAARMLNEQADQADQGAADLGVPNNLSDRLESVCASFEQGTAVYLHYRLLSLDAHPTSTSAETWLGLDADDHLVFKNPPPDEPGTAHALVAALALASTGFLDVLKADNTTRRFRNTINREASATGLPWRRLSPKTAR